MNTCYLRLVIILGIQQQVFPHSANLHQRIIAFRHNSKKERQALQLSSKPETPDYVDLNYDLIVSEPSEMETTKPGLRLGGRHRHRHRKHRSRKDIGKDANITTKKQTTIELATAVTTVDSIPETATTSNIRSETFETNTKELNEKAETAIGNATSETIETNIKELKEKVETAIVNAPNETFENKVRQLEDKVQTAINNLNKFLHETDNKRGDENETYVRPLEEKVERKSLKIYVNETEIRKGEENFATTTHNPRKSNSKVSHAVPFYRRLNYLHDTERNKPQKWVHCLDLITPKLQGMNGNDWPPIEVTWMNGDVKRLAQLLYLNVTDFTKEDMVSVLTQISKIRIRMYQWDYTAITLIFNVLIKGSDHSFRTLKAGIKSLFDKWHLDTSDKMLPIFLEQTRIFRPPCIDITGYSGYTKKPGAVAFLTKPHKTTKYHDPDVSCKSQEKKYNNDP